ncbi:MAG: thiamine pyrophosphate-dependent dehydrogenase E1 component subunit alpha [Chloroflexi bacterium]|nr:thiamine pyrophosphate-dependent dehydrogenase E1 component subunit alpha [Chloroflexota bacterium]
MLAFPRERILEYYRRMLLIRRFEESLIKLTKSGNSFGHFHVYVGQETTGVPALALLRPDDYAFTTHRNHGHLLARGADSGRLLAEIVGKATGYNKGKGGTLHVAVRELGAPVTSAIVGSTVPLATGAAFAIKQLRGQQVSLSLFGDGALEEGAFSESVNIAALWKLPVIYLCENNSLEAPGAAAGEYPSSTIAVSELASIVKPFGIPSASVDGTDVAAVHAVMSDAIDRARRGDGPTFIETITVRWPGSRPLWPDLLTGETDLAVAWDESRIPQEYSEWHRRQDGLLRFTRELLGAKLLAPGDVLAIDREVKVQIDRAIEFALESPYPEREAALEGVFA